MVLMLAGLLIVLLLPRHSSPSEQAVRVPNTKDAKALLLHIAAPRAFVRSTACSGSLGRLETCFVRRPAVRLSSTELDAWLTESGLASPAVECGHSARTAGLIYYAFCLGDAKYGTEKMVVAARSRMTDRIPHDGSRPTSADIQPSGATTISVAVVGEALRR